MSKRISTNINIAPITTSTSVTSSPIITSTSVTSSPIITSTSVTSSPIITSTFNNRSIYGNMRTNHTPIVMNSNIFDSINSTNNPVYKHTQSMSSISSISSISSMPSPIRATVISNIYNISKDNKTIKDLIQKHISFSNSSLSYNLVNQKIKELINELKHINSIETVRIYTVTTIKFLLEIHYKRELAIMISDFLIDSMVSKILSFPQKIEACCFCTN